MTTLGSIARRLAICALASTLLASCATFAVDNARGDQGLPTTIDDPPAKPNAKTVLIALPRARDFLDVRRGLVTEIKRDFNVTTMVISPETRVEEFAAALEKTAPVCVVLMNNSSLALFQQYQSGAGDKKVPPAVVLMTSFLEDTAARMKNVTGIAYEVPGLTSFVYLRSIVNTPVKRVGVVYRPGFRRFIERQKTLAARENFQLVPVAVPADVSADDLISALRTLTEGGKVDAVWMLNDNGLIRDADFLADTWRVVLQDAGVPLLVGVPNLIDPEEPLGTLAVVPDHEALGLQAANIIFDLADNDWKVEGRGIELPLSVKTVVDMRQARERFGLKPDAQQHIDRPLEGND
jgi:putative ABC transport system substrate-binding protein